MGRRTPACRPSRWTASDADNDALSFTVQYSSGPQAAWTTLAANISGSELAVDPKTLPGSDRARVRVIATDGLRTSIDGSFTVHGKPPTAVIIVPSPKIFVTQLGASSDQDEGVLPDTAFRWTSSKDGTLGTGTRIDVSSLTPGDHVI